MFISEADFLQQIKQAVAEGVEMAMERRDALEAKDRNRPVLISEIAEKYGYHTKTLLRRARERHIQKVSLKPASIRAIDIDELIAA